MSYWTYAGKERLECEKCMRYPQVVACKYSYLPRRTQVFYLDGQSYLKQRYSLLEQSWYVSELVSERVGIIFTRK